CDRLRLPTHDLVEGDLIEHGRGRQDPVEIRYPVAVVVVAIPRLELHGEVRWQRVDRIQRHDGAPSALYKALYVFSPPLRDHDPSRCAGLALIPGASQRTR